MTEMNIDAFVETKKLINVESQAFAMGFPELAPGMRYRPLTREQMQEKALLYAWALAKRVLPMLGIRNEYILEQMVDRFIRRIFAGKALDVFDAQRGDLEAFLLGIMRYIGLECWREQRRRPAFVPIEAAVPMETGFAGIGVADPARIAERNDMIEALRRWMLELKEDERNAVARKYEVFSDLDTGTAVRNETVKRHRALERLREWANS
jgi:hypothetical protein